MRRRLPGRSVSWGRVRTDACTVGGGESSRCEAMELGGETVEMFVVVTDGPVRRHDVTETDRFYLGMRCEY